MGVLASDTKAASRALALMISAVMACACAHAGARDTLVLRGTKIYVAPDAPAIENGVVLVQDGKVTAVGRREDISIPRGARDSSCSGAVVTAGFQNSHVHFIGEPWNRASEQSAEDLTHHLTKMLTRYGYTTVVDTASELPNTLALRVRIDRGEVLGPRILTAGWALFPAGGIPAYLSHLPPEFLEQLRQPATVQAAEAEVRENLSAGADAIKLFLATPQGHGKIEKMSAEIALAASNEAHLRGKMVMAHPTDLDGVQAALAADVDVLVHTTLGVETPWPDTLRRDVVEAGMAVVPTLKLMRYELNKEGVPEAVAKRLIAASVEHVRTFVEAHGEVLFGTDVGYMTDYDPTEEYVLMSQAGLTPMQILASLTTAPAQRWNESKRRGRLAAGLDADIVVLEADPAAQPENFAKVRCAFRQGTMIFAAPMSESTRATR